jgi:ectoine hydroxylase-related dioxygenase (phytanoyl-CoA dioxygenase family)
MMLDVAQVEEEMPTMDLRKEYEEKGFVSFPELLDSKQVQALLNEIDRISANSTLASHDKSRLEMEPDQKPDGRLIRRIYEPCTHYFPFKELSDSARILDPVESLLGPDLLYQYSKLNMKPPSIGSVVEWHQDVTYYPLTNDSSLAVLIYLDDADVGNGCLLMLSGEHHGKILDHNQNGYFVGKIVEPIDESKAVPVEGKAGTAIFMHCMTPHASVTNRSSRPRRTLILSYRAADCYPVYTGDITDELECCTRQVRGKPASSARFTFQQFPIPRRKQHVASLYELQELSRKQTA